MMATAWIEYPEAGEWEWPTADEAGYAWKLDGNVWSFPTWDKDRGVWI